MSPADWLICPVCGRDFEAVDPATLVCSTGHRFEANRRGYFALTTSRSGAIRSEPAAALDAVDARWASEASASVLDALLAAAPATPRLRVLDVGDDLGHALSHLLEQRSEWSALHVGSSPAGVARTMARTQCEGLLVDPITPWPVRDSVANLALATTGVPAPVELHRVLAPGAVLLTAVDADMVGTVVDDLFPWFEHDQTRAAVGASVLRLRRRRRVWR